MGSVSDSRIMQNASWILDEYKIKHEDQIVSAHRTPTRLIEYAKHAETKGFKVIIAGAGGAAHLPGMIASHTIIPVIGVPILIYNDKSPKKYDKKFSAFEGIETMHLIVLVFCFFNCHLFFFCPDKFFWKFVVECFLGNASQVQLVGFKIGSGFCSCF